MTDTANKAYSLYHLIMLTVFVGILLTGAIFYLVTAAIGGENNLTDACFDGTVIEGTDPFSALDRAVYQNTTSLKRVRNYQYRVFGIVGTRDVIAGKNDFLFEVEDTENNYNYLDDYLGRLSFTYGESAAILQQLTDRKNTYAEVGAEFLLVILPNSQTVYSEYMPTYLGDIRTTRLDCLEEYLLENGFTDFVNLTDDLLAYKTGEPLYNNTENSLNALGLYYTYRAVCARFQPTVMAKTRVIPRGDLSFYQHLTTGKAVARRAGLSDVALNLTVSLANNTKLNYHIQHADGRVAKTRLLPFESVDVSQTPSILLQFSGTWERLQLEPFFSNTFLNVTYQTDLKNDPEIFELARPRVVIQFIYENELSQLLSDYN